MRKIILGTFLLLTTGCRPHFALVDEACKDPDAPIPGGSKLDANDPARGAFWRLNCYRRLARMAPAKVDERVVAADEAHAAYLDTNGVCEDCPKWYEDMSLEGATGERPLERVIAQGYEVPDGYNDIIGFWEGAETRLDTLVPRDVIDDYVDNYHWRQVILQPGWIDGGWGTSEFHAVFTSLYEFPPMVHSGNPVVYPVDGQVGVPTSFRMPYDGDPVPFDATVGYPISVTVGSDDPTSVLTNSNPYDLVLLEAVVWGPNDQALEIWVVTPDSSGFSLPYSVVLVPKEPLASGTEYNVYTKLSWNYGIVESEWSFTTRIENAGTARRVDAGDVAERLGPPPKHRWISRDDL